MQTTLERSGNAELNGNAGNIIAEQTQLDNALSNSPDNSLPADLKTRNDGLLSLKDVAHRLDPDADGPQFYGRLRRFADAPGIGEYLGAVDVPGAKGVRYEPRAVGVFGRLIAASDAKAVTPATAVAWLKTTEENGRAEAPGETAIAERTLLSNSAELSNSPAALVPMPRPDTPTLTDFLAVAAAQGRAQGLAQSERVLTAKEAAQALSISPALLRKTVPAWRRFGISPRGDRWLLSQLVSAAQAESEAAQ